MIELLLVLALLGLVYFVVVGRRIFQFCDLLLELLYIEHELKKGCIANGLPYPEDYVGSKSIEKYWTRYQLIPWLNLAYYREIGMQKIREIYEEAK